MANIVNNEKPILKVRNLRISFKTNTGTVKAVRGIDFSLYKGRTLAIVGESGSGKSVTSKAILGILANNKIIEDGRIIYDGKDLLTLPENKFTKIRGVKISMIFQDPLSALNPIMKVGKQLTEAMHLENKALVRSAKKGVNNYNSAIAKAEGKQAIQAIDALTKDIKDEQEVYKALKENAFDFFQDTANKQNEIYLEALNKAEEAVKAYKEKFLNADATNVDIKEATKALAGLKKPLGACKNFFTQSADDVTDVYVSLMKTYFKQMLTSDKLDAALKEELTKYNVDNFFDLPAKVRAKQREVITPRETYYELIQDITTNLINHFEELKQKYATIDASEVDELIKNYAKLLVTKDSKLSGEAAKARAIELMREVGIPEPEKRFNQYPFEFSGGMRQRIVIAIALSGNPEILICDEPTTALDVTIQAQILELIQKLKVQKNLSIIFITHDLGVVANMADDIAVMYAGKIVEYGSVYDIFYDPRHPYTWALLSSMPDLDTQGKLEAIPGTPPNMLLPPRGDAFAARNNYAIALDYKQEPPFFKVSETHSVKTWLAHADAVDVVPPKTVINRIAKSLKTNPDNTPKYTLKKNSVLEIIKGGKK